MIPVIFAPMQRYFLEVMYNGTAFHGSQLQGELPTVQLVINEALRVLLKEDILSFGASRTDEGVHATNSYYHFDTDIILHPKFHYRLNAILPASVAITNIYRCIGEPINARFDAVSRMYRYRVYQTKNPFYVNRALYYPYHIQQELLQKSAAIIKEYTDFESFAKRNSQSKTTFCTIYDSYWEHTEDQLHYIVKANRFLRGMVRGLVGTQLQVARGRHSLEDFRKIMDAKDCTQADFSVPGHGLYLEEIIYPEGKLEKLNLY